MIRLALILLILLLASLLIFNKKFSVSPVTTHLPFKDVSKKINKDIVENNILRIDEFYKKILRKKPKIAILGLNPHCESKYKNNEELNIIKPVILIIASISPPVPLMKLLAFIITAVGVGNATPIPSYISAKIGTTLINMKTITVIATTNITTG